MISEMCSWLHERLEALPLFQYPFDSADLPENGIYFFYEKTEVWGHGGVKPRIVRIGTHRDGNFKSRIAQHYLLDDEKFKFDKAMPAPKDRSIFRKNIGRALLNKRGDQYADLWEIDFTTSANQNLYKARRNVDHEIMIEQKITDLLRKTFSFRFIAVPEEWARLGSSGLECALIGTCAGCDSCVPSRRWLGLHSTKAQIRDSGLWLVQHLNAPCLTEKQKKTLNRYIKETEKCMGSR